MDRIHGVRRQQWDFAGETIDRPATVLDGLVQPQIAIQSCGSPETVMSLFETTQAADSGFGQRVPLHEGRVTQKRDHVRESTFEENHGLGECRAGPHFWANLQFGKPILCILLRLALVEQTPDALNEPANLGEQGLFLQERRQRFPLRGLQVLIALEEHVAVLPDAFGKREQPRRRFGCLDRGLHGRLASRGRRGRLLHRGLRGCLAGRDLADAFSTGDSTGAWPAGAAADAFCAADSLRAFSTRDSPRALMSFRSATTDFQSFRQIFWTTWK